MFLQGDPPLQNLHESSTSRVVWAWVGLAAMLVTSSQVQAQQYLYYPTSGAYQSSYYVAQPAYYYTQPTYAYGAGGGYRYSQPTYSPQYYQQSYAPQYYQYTYALQSAQTYQAAQTTTDGQQVIPASYTVPVAEAAPAQPAAAAAPSTDGGDPYGFLSWLNSVRASYGLGAVGYDQNLSNWAAQNNNAQMAQGLGHFVMGPARRQNSAMGADFPGAMWMASPAHRAALLDPTISWIGIAAAGAYWTFNAY